MDEAMSTEKKIKNSQDCLLIIAMSITLLSGCRNAERSKARNSQSEQKTFEYYKIKYTKTVQHYQSPPDSLKLKALYFILKNLDDQFFFKGKWIDEYQSAILNSKQRSVSDFEAKLDSIKQLYPGPLVKIKDENIITDKYLVENIDRAFESRKNPWVKDLNFSDFCEYVLPYKIGNEQPETWGACLEKTDYLRPDSLAGLTDMFKAASYVNSHLNWFTISGSYDYPTDAGYELSRLIATGTCYSSTKMALFQCRALGLPVVIDYAPSWGNRSRSHYWNALIYNNRPYPFDATYANIGFYKIEFMGVGRMPYKISKVFRKTYAVQANSLKALNKSYEPIPSVFADDRFKDVTNDYVPVSDVRLSYANALNHKFGYLCTFNDQTWTPSFWGLIDNNQLTFRNMGRDVLYLPALYDSSGFTVVGDPFILNTGDRSSK